MEEGMASNLMRTQRLEDVPELINKIQSLLGRKEAARTCILSKSWHYAWSMIPNLRFVYFTMHYRTERKYMNLIDCTLQRYIRDDIPIESFDLNLVIADSNSTFLVGTWIRSIAIKSCLKELNLTISCYTSDSYAFPDEIFSGENLDTVRLKAEVKFSNRTSSNLVIKCLSLRVLELQNVHMNEDVLNHLLCTCSLLESIKLIYCRGLGTIKVENLGRLRVLNAKLMRNHKLEVLGVPKIRVFSYESFDNLTKPLPFDMDSLRRVSHLLLGRVNPNKDFTDMINSKFPFLESLTLRSIRNSPQNIDIRCLTLKRLNLQFWENEQYHVQVYAPRLAHFCYEGYTIPNLLFPTITPEQIKLSLRLDARIELVFFLKMRELLNISSKFYIEILGESSNSLLPLNTSLTKLRKRVPIPAINVQQLSILASSDHVLWEQSALLDAFFSICHPTHVKVYQDMGNYRRDTHNSREKMFRELMIKKIEKGNWCNLAAVEIIIPKHNKICFSDRVIRGVWWCSVEFKLHWHSSIDQQKRGVLDRTRSLLSGYFCLGALYRICH